jgi:hypothetical protein
VPEPGNLSGPRAPIGGTNWLKLTAPTHAQSAVIGAFFCLVATIFCDRSNKTITAAVLRPRHDPKAQGVPERQVGSHSYRIQHHCRRHCPSNYRHCLQYRPKAQLHILLRFNSAEIGHPMRHMLFFVAIVGILGAIDAVELKGENRAALWRTVQSQGQIFNSGIEQSLRRHLW